MRLEEQIELNELILSALESERPMAQFEELNIRLRSDAEALDHYLEFLSNYVNLTCPDLSETLMVGVEPSGSTNKEGSDRSLLEGDGLPAEASEPLRADTAIWKRLLDTEQSAAPLPFLCPPAPSPLQKRGKAKDKKPRGPSKLPVYAAAGLVASLLFVLVLVQFPPFALPPVVGEVTDAIDVRWGPEHPGEEVGYFFRAGRQDLRAGTVAMRLRGGVKLVAEGPAVFEVTGPERVVLHRGRLSAYVPQECVGFAVDTRAGTFTDLGTEFGVAITGDGDSEVQVFTGKIGLEAGERSEYSIIEQHQARAVQAGTGAVTTIDYVEQSFVRHIDSRSGLLWTGEPLSLTDLFVGGSGFGIGSPKPSSIDPTTGEIHAECVHTTRVRESGELFSAVPGRGVVDGVFVADGGLGAVQVTTTGLRFGGFGDTSGNCWSDISTTGTIQAWLMENPAQKTWVELVLDGAACGEGSEQASLLVHPNAGVTFDLGRIRAMQLGLRLDRFRAHCGISETSPGRNRQATFWVLVDGEEAFRWTSTGPEDGLKPVDIELGRDARFLTLATSEAVNTNYDWCLFLEPVLTLSPTSD